MAHPVRTKGSLALLAATFTIAATALPLAFAGSAYGAPNILFIVTDDQELEGTMAVMPKTTKWFKDGNAAAGIIGGTEFTQANATTPVCCPARSSILTGRYAHNHGVRKNSDGANLDHNTTLEYRLGQAGYRTGIFGKFLNAWDVRVNPPHWTDWAIFSAQKYAGFEVNEQGTLKFNWKYSTNYVADQAEAFLQRAENTNDSQPWFMYVAPTSPHGPYDPEPKYQDASVLALQEDAAYFEADRRDKPYWVQTRLHDSDTIKRDWLNHLRLLKTADDLVERVMQKLRALNEDQETLAFFVSDNGYMWGEHGLRTKAVPYQEAIRVPLYLRWPGWAGHSGTRTDSRLVALIDMAPTALAAAGITPATPMDGRSLLDTSSSRSRILSEGWGGGAAQGDPPCPGAMPTWAAFRALTFHYIEYYETLPVGSSGCNATEHVTNYDNIVAREYYDTRPTGDPLELTNLLGDGVPGNDPPTAELSAQLAADRTCSGSTCTETPSDPDTLMAERPPSVSGSASASFSLTSSVPGSTFECRLDDFFGSQPFTPCSSNDTWSGLSSGSHKLEARSVAPGGSRDSTPDSYTWTVETSFPETQIGEGPANPSTAREALFEFASSDPNAGFQCRLDSNLEADFQPCFAPQSYESLADGSHTFEVRAVRSPAQADPTPASFTWTVDATPPDTQIAPDSNFLSTHRSIAYFSLTATASSSSSEAEDPERFECRLDGASYASCESPKTITGLTKGAHTLRVRARDLAGNTDPTPAVYSWTIDAIQTFRNAAHSTWPQVTAGTEVRAILPDGSGGFFIGGDFTEIGFPAGPRWQRTDLAHIKADGTVDEAWKPSTENGRVNSIAGAGGVYYIGGTFTGLKGSNDVAFTPRNRLGGVAAGTGNLTSWNPNASNAVNALAWGRRTSTTGPAPSTLYAAGSFQTIGGVTRRKIAEIKFSDGTVTTWNPDANSTANLNALAVTDRNVYVGGANLTQVGGKTRNNLAEIDRFTGQASDWNPNPNNYITSLLVRPLPDGLPTIYAGGTFTSIGQPPSSRLRAAEISLVDNGSATSWDPAPSGAIYGFHAFDCFSRCSTILGGTFSTLKSAGAAPVARSKVAETGSSSGDPQDWNPNLDKAVQSIACSAPSGSSCDGPSGTLALGGLFTTTGGIGVPTSPRNLLAFYAGCPLTSPC